MNAKFWFDLNCNMQRLFGIFTLNLRLTNMRKLRLTSKKWRNTSSIGDMFGQLGCSSFEIRGDQSPLHLFHSCVYS